ncbi:ABC transporter permease [Natrarchaeobius oligotrophus]|nr:ABC transporter permease subunit [Natrarchaeobius chitinivorans]
MQTTFLPTPWEIGYALEEQFEQGLLIPALEAAVYAIAVGYFIAVIVGIPVGVAMGIDRHVNSFLNPYVNAIYVVPFSALVPALVIWFGTGYQVRVLVVFFFAVFPIVMNSQEGARTAPENLIEAARSFGADRLYIIRNIVLPHEISYVVAGLRLGIGRAVKGLVITELLISATGFGLLLHRYSARLEFAGVFSVVLLLMTMGIVSVWTLKQIESRIVHWEA